MLAVAAVSNAEMVARLGIVVVLCGAIGLERQARDQVAGLRTHVIVGLGAALFTLVSAYAFAGFGPSGTDPTRIAAQVVSGIGFLGAGAILRHGATVRGVTTAAALWISAAVGMATAAGFYFGAVATTVLALTTLVALRRLRPLLKRLGTETLSLELHLAPGASLRRLLAELRARALRVEALESRVLDDGSEQLRIDLRAPASFDLDGILSRLSELPEVDRVEFAMVHSPDLGAGEDSWRPVGGSRLPLRPRVTGKRRDGNQDESRQR